MGVIRLYHTGFSIIEKPDIKAGRTNADFGQGFYLSPDREFSRRWARKRKGFATYLNEYELDTRNLNIKRFTRDSEWFGYISSNRFGRKETLPDYDVIAGPVANDTIYDTFGIITSGYLQKDQALRLLMAGPQYSQVAIKTEKAVLALRFLCATEITSTELQVYRQTVQEEELEFQKEFAALLSELVRKSGL